MMFWVFVILIINISASFFKSQDSFLKFDDKSYEFLNSCGPDSWTIYGNGFEGIDFEGDEYALGAKGPGEFCSNLKMDVNCQGSFDFSIEYYLETGHSEFIWDIKDGESIVNFIVPLGPQNEWTIFNGYYWMEDVDLEIQFKAQLDETEIILIKYLRVHCFETTTNPTTTTPISTTEITKTTTTTTRVPTTTTTTEILTEETTTSSSTDSPLIEMEEHDNGKTLWMILAFAWMTLFVIAVIVILFLKIKSRIQTSKPVFIKINSSAPVYYDNEGCTHPRGYPRWGNPISREGTFNNVYDY